MLAHPRLCLAVSGRWVWCLCALSGIFCDLTTTALATDIYWTNTAGGNWNVAANWSPNIVPGSSDNAFIVSNSTYTVTLNANATVQNLTLGGSSGTQTLSNGVNNLTVNVAGNVGNNGVLTFGGGTL